MIPGFYQFFFWFLQFAFNGNVMFSIFALVFYCIREEEEKKSSTGEKHTNFIYEALNWLRLNIIEDTWLVYMEFTFLCIYYVTKYLAVLYLAHIFFLLMFVFLLFWKTIRGITYSCEFTVVVYDDDELP